MYLHHEGLMIGIQCQLFVKDTLEHLKWILIFFSFNGCVGKLTFKSNYALLFYLRWKGYEVKNHIRGQSKHGLWGCSVKTGNFLSWA